MVIFDESEILLSVRQVADVVLEMHVDDVFDELINSPTLQVFLKNEGFLVNYFVSHDIDAKTIPSELVVLLLEYYAYRKNNAYLKEKMQKFVQLGIKQQ